MFQRFLTIPQALIASGIAIGIYLITISIEAIIIYLISKDNKHSFAKKMYTHFKYLIMNYLLGLLLVIITSVWLGYVPGAIVIIILGFIIIIKYMFTKSMIDFNSIYDIVKENKCDVGEYVSINDLSGKVIKFTLKGIELEDTSGKYIHLKGRNIVDVINKSRNLIDVKILVSVPLAKDINSLKLIIEKELPSLNKDYPMIIEGPNFEGVSDISATAYTISLSTKMKYEDVDMVTKVIRYKVLELVGK